MRSRNGIKEIKGRKGIKEINKNSGKNIRRIFFKKSAGIDGILVTVGLCIIALLLCVVMKDRLAIFIETIINSLTNKATSILSA